MEAGTGGILGNTIAIETALAPASLGEVDFTFAVMNRIYTNAMIPRGRETPPARGEGEPWVSWLRPSWGHKRGQVERKRSSDIHKLYGRQPPALAYLGGMRKVAQIAEHTSIFDSAPLAGFVRLVTAVGTDEGKDPFEDRGR